MKITTQYHYQMITLRAAIILAVLFAALLGLVTTVRAASEQPVDKGSRVITIYDQGEKRVVLTGTHTVGDTLKQAGISLSDSDKVEPALTAEYTAQSYTVNIYRAHPVMIIDGMKRQQILSPYTAPRDIARHAGLKTRDEDKLTLTAAENVLSDGVGSRLTIKRATEVSLVLYGERTTVYTQLRTVNELLREKKISLGGDDTLSVPKTQAITPGMTVEIWRNGVQTVTEQQPVDFAIEQIQDADQPAGYRKVQTPGVKGEKTVTYEVTMKNGQEVERKEIQSVVTKQPEKEVVVVGIKASNTFNGSFSDALARLRSCEGSYTSNTGNGYYGAYQYDIGTWANYGGYANAALAPPAVQDEKAWLTYQARGWSPWPSCSRKLGLPDTYR